MLTGMIIHIAAGSVAIASGAGAAAARKGTKIHRAFGKAFVASMVVMALLGVYLALFTTPVAGTTTPPEASTTIAVLTLYLVLTAWLTVRRKTRRAGVPEYGAFLFALAISVTLLVFAARSALDPAGQKLFAPYFAFATFAMLAGAMDLKVILSGGIAGAQRIARHLWRMCFSLFFASAFFFLGQQKVMPAWLQGSPILVLLAIAPLLVMAVWLIRIWATQAAASTASRFPPPA